MKKTFFAVVLLFSTTPLFAQTPAPVYSETMDVAAIRADDAVPVTKTDIKRDEIEARYHGQDVPLLMRDAPSINAYSESGAGGAGYSYISLRGIGATRINFTLDGVPLADSEDMGTYFVDFPDLARSLESIQIQRGVGTSTFGSASYGGSVNLESINVAQDHRIDATLGAGSHNLFFSGTKSLAGAQWKLTGFSGHENQQLSFYATDEATLQSDLRNNPLRPEERDSFGYDLGQLQYIRALGNDSDMTASAYYQRGYGWYRLFDFGTDVLRQYGLDGLLIGSIVTYEHRAGAITTNYGVHVNRFEREHTRDDLSLDTRDYANDGVKGEANAFAKIRYDAGRWTLFGDAQLRRASFDYHGTADIEGIDWTFFNPKIGARFSVNASSSVYASAGMSTREPTRNDMFQGEDDASFAHDLHAVRPERVLDLEAGWRYGTSKGSIVANVYAMEFHNEIASTGELSEIGLLLRRNVDRSHRRGIEVDAAWRLSDKLHWKGTASLSHNRIDEWTQFFDLYDNDGNYTGSRGVVYEDVEPLLTPSVLIAQTLTYAPNARLVTSATGRYVGRSWLDNTNDRDFDAPAFFLVDANVSYGVTPWMRVTLQANNLLDADRVYPSGYSYRYYAGDVRGGTAYYYPQATRNAVVLLDFDF
jgi:iron complex outermembrane receptor protein